VQPRANPWAWQLPAAAKPRNPAIAAFCVCAAASARMLRQCFTAGTASTIPVVDVVSVIRIVAAELKLELQRACVGDVEGVVREAGLRCRQQGNAELAIVSPRSKGCGCITRD